MLFHHMGIASALDTRCGQSYWAKQYHILGIHMQRAMLILLLVCIPLSIIWANTRRILIAVGQDPEISREAGTYARFMIPSLFAYGLLQPLIRFLQTQNNVVPVMLSSAVATLLHVSVCWALIFKSGLGSRGAAIANAMSYWVNVLFLVMYVKLSPSCSKTWTGLSREALHNIATFMRLAIPSAVMACLEMWSFEMMVLLSGLLPNPTLETSVLSICLNTTSTIWMSPSWLSAAVSIRVLNEMGAGNPKTARLAVRAIMIMAVTEGIVVGAILILIRNVREHAYSNEKEVVEYVAVMMPILATSHFLDSIQGVLSGTVRGHSLILVHSTLLGFRLRLSWILSLHIGGKGMWFGIICALVVQAFSLLIITLRTNWDQEAEKATERVYDHIVPSQVVS